MIRVQRRLSTEFQVNPLVFLEFSSKLETTNSRIRRQVFGWMASETSDHLFSTYAKFFEKGKKC